VTDANDEMNASSAAATSAVNSVATEGETQMTKTKAVPSNAKIARLGIGEMFKAVRYAVARDVNWQISTTYWKIREEMTLEKLVEQPAINLKQQCGCGFAGRNLWQLRGFDRTWPNQQIRQTLSDESLTGIVSNDLDSSPSSALEAAVRPHFWCFPVLRLLSKRNREARSIYETEVLDSG
jgi:hypothetical protein